MSIRFISHEMKRLRRGLSAKLALMSPRFHGLLPAGSAIERIDYQWGAENGPLMVFLPGIGDVAEDFVRRGFVDEVRRHGAAAGAAVLDAHYGYYASRTLHALLRDGVVDAARNEGFREIWMTGISLGGFGAASFVAAHPEQVAGLLLLAPYLGDDALIREIRSAGGPRKWNPGSIDKEDYARQLWAWLRREYATDTPSMPLYLGYGEGDRFVEAHRLLADLVPTDHVHAVQGGHDWHTWGRLWRYFMGRKDVMSA